MSARHRRDGHVVDAVIAVVLRDGASGVRLPLPAERLATVGAHARQSVTRQRHGAGRPAQPLEERKVRFVGGGRRARRYEAERRRRLHAAAHETRQRFAGGAGGRGRGGVGAAGEVEGGRAGQAVATRDAGAGGGGGRRVARLVQQAHHLGSVLALNVHLGPGERPRVVPLQPVEAFDGRRARPLVRRPLRVQETRADGARVHAAARRRLAGAVRTLVAGEEREVRRCGGGGVVTPTDLDLLAGAIYTAHVADETAEHHRGKLRQETPNTAPRRADHGHTENTDDVSVQEKASTIIPAILFSSSLLESLLQNRL